MPNDPTQPDHDHPDRPSDPSDDGPSDASDAPTAAGSAPRSRSGAPPTRQADTPHRAVTGPRDPGARRGLRKLPPGMEALAGGETDRLRRPRGPRTQLHDERERLVIIGVNNRDARHVFDARVAALRTESDPAERGRGLLDVLQLRLWRARAVTGFDAFASDIVGIPVEEAKSLVKAAAAERGVAAEPLPDAQAALWLRTESALREHAPGGQVRFEPGPGAGSLSLRVPLDDAHAAVSALAGVGRQAAGLGRHLERVGGTPQRDARDARDAGDQDEEAAAHRSGGGPGGPTSSGRDERDGGHGYRGGHGSGYTGGHTGGHRGGDGPPRRQPPRDPRREDDPRYGDPRRQAPRDPYRDREQQGDRRDRGHRYGAGEGEGRRDRRDDRRDPRDPDPRRGPRGPQPGPRSGPRSGGPRFTGRDGNDGRRDGPPQRPRGGPNKRRRD